MMGREERWHTSLLFLSYCSKDLIMLGTGMQNWPNVWRYRNPSLLCNLGSPPPPTHHRAILISQINGADVSIPQYHFCHLGGNRTPRWAHSPVPSLSQISLQLTFPQDTRPGQQEQVDCNRNRHLRTVGSGQGPGHSRGIAQGIRSEKYRLWCTYSIHIPQAKFRDT